MSLLIKIPLFLGFLVFLVVWLVATFFALLRMVVGFRTTSAAGFLFTTVLPLDLVGLLGLFGMLGLTALFFDLGILSLMLLGVALGYLFAFVSWEILGPLDKPFGSRVLWATARMTLDERLQKFNNVVSGLILLGVVLALSYLFFTEDIPSSEATQRIFKVVVVYLGVAFLITVLPLRLAQLLSVNVDEEARTRLLLIQVGGLFTWTLYISLILWSFGIAGDGFGLPASGVDATLSVTVVLILVGVFLVTSLLPYLLGWRRARGWRQRLLQRERATVDRLISILKAPGEAAYADGLRRLQDDVAEEYDEFVERDPMVQRSLEWEHVGSADEVDPKQQLVFEAYRDVRESDPRLTHLEFLRRLRDELATIAEGLAAQKRKDQRRKKAESHLSYYEDERKRIDERRAQETGRNWVWAGGSLVLLPVMGGVLSKIGERVWDIIDKAPAG